MWDSRPPTVSVTVGTEHANGGGAGPVWTRRREASLRGALFAAAVLVPCLVLPWLPEAHRPSVVLHAALEASGANLALTLFLVTATLGRGLREPLVGLPALAFLAMGLLDLAHLAVTPGAAAPVVHLAATAGGGLAFAALALPDRFRVRVSRGATAALLAAGCVALGGWALGQGPGYGTAAPGDLAAHAVGAFSAIGFTLGAWGLSRGPIRGSRWLVAVAGLFAAEALAFGAAAPWSTRWWSSHALHVAGFVVGLGTTVEGVRALVRRLERTRARLAHRNAALRASNDALARTIQALEASNVELDRYTSVAAHDLREPLRTVRGYLDLLEADHGDDVGEGGRELLGFATEATTRLDRLTSDLLLYARLGSQPPARAPVDLGALLGEVRADLRDAIARTGADVRVGPLPTVTADAPQLRMLFQNLLSNALKFHDGAPRVRVDAEHRGDAWALIVRDDGIGIDPAYHARIFEPFARLERREAYEGTGIGLAICRRIVERHGGDIAVRSNVGAGTTFTVTLPADAAVAEATTP